MTSHSPRIYDLFILKRRLNIVTLCVYVHSANMNHLMFIAKNLLNVQRKTVALKNQLNWKEFIDCQEILNCSIFFYCVIYGILISNLINWTMFVSNSMIQILWCFLAKFFELHINKLVQCKQFQEGYRNEFKHWHSISMIIAMRFKFISIREFNGFHIY